MKLAVAKQGQSTRLSAYYLWVLGIVFIGLAIFGYIKAPWMILAHLFATAAGIVLLVFGVLLYRTGRKAVEEA